MYLKIFLYTLAVVEYCDSPVKVDEFKKNSKARILSGYTKSVESSLSAIHGIEFFGEYIIRIPASTVLKILKKNFGVLENTLGFKYLIKIKTGKDINIYAWMIFRLHNGSGRKYMNGEMDWNLVLQDRIKYWKYRMYYKFHSKSK